MSNHQQHSHDQRRAAAKVCSKRDSSSVACKLVSASHVSPLGNHMPHALGSVFSWLRDNGGHSTPNNASAAAQQKLGSATSRAKQGLKRRAAVLQLHAQLAAGGGLAAVGSSLHQAFCPLTTELASLAPGTTSDTHPATGSGSSATPHPPTGTPPSSGSGARQPTGTSPGSGSGAQQPAANTAPGGTARDPPASPPPRAPGGGSIPGSTNSSSQAHLSHDAARLLLASTAHATGADSPTVSQPPASSGGGTGTDAGGPSGSDANDPAALLNSLILTFYDVIDEYLLPEWDAIHSWCLAVATLAPPEDLAREGLPDAAAAGADATAEAEAVAAGLESEAQSVNDVLEEIGVRERDGAFVAGLGGGGGARRRLAAMSNATKVVPGFKPQLPAAQAPILVPYVFHIMTFQNSDGSYGPPGFQNSSAYVNGLVAAVNKIYTSTGIQFFVRQVNYDPVANPYLLVAGGYPAWSNCSQGMFYLNSCVNATWFAANAVDFPRSLNVFVIGDGATLPISYSFVGGNAQQAVYGHIGTTFTIVDSSANGMNRESNWQLGGTALAHESGHFFNLQHTFHMNENNNTAGSCVDNDGIADTPTTDLAAPFLPPGPNGVSVYQYCYAAAQGLWGPNSYQPGISSFQPAYTAWSRIGIHAGEQSSQFNSCPNSTLSPFYEGNDEMGNLMGYFVNECFAAFGHLTAGQVAAIHRGTYRWNPILYNWAQYYASVAPPAPPPRPPRPLPRPSTPCTPPPSRPPPPPAPRRRPPPPPPSPRRAPTHPALPDPHRPPRRPPCPRRPVRRRPNARSSHPTRPTSQSPHPRPISSSAQPITISAVAQTAVTGSTTTSQPASAVPNPSQPLSQSASAVSTATLSQPASAVSTATVTVAVAPKPQPAQPVPSTPSKPESPEPRAALPRTAVALTTHPLTASTASAAAQTTVTTAALPQPKPSVTKPSASESTTSSSEPSGFEPSSSQPSGSEPSGSEPSGSEPSGSEPSGSEPSGSEPSGSKPSGSEPSVPQPITSLTAPTLTQPQPPLSIAAATQSQPVTFSASARPSATLPDPPPSPPSPSPPPQISPASTLAAIATPLAVPPHPQSAFTQPPPPLAPENQPTTTTSITAHIQPSRPLPTTSVTARIQPSRPLPAGANTTARAKAQTHPGLKAHLPPAAGLTLSRPLSSLQRTRHSPEAWRAHRNIIFRLLSRTLNHTAEGWQQSHAPTQPESQTIPARDEIDIDIDSPSPTLLTHPLSPGTREECLGRRLQKGDRFFDFLKNIGGGGGAKQSKKVVRPTVIPEPSFNVPIALLAISGVSLYTGIVGESPVGVPFGVLSGVLGAFLTLQATRVKFIFDDEALELQISGKETDNVVVGGQNRWSYESFVNWEFWWPGFPVLVYFKEDQTTPEGQVHFFPIIGEGKALYNVMVERCGPSVTSGPKEVAESEEEEEEGDN
ncbi:MAG: hypothetical protein WDW36_008402 [Sanguina aurantia]